MSVMSNQQVGIYNFNDEVVAVPLFQLIQWKHALKLEMKTGMTFQGGRKASTHVRKFLSAPRSFKIEGLYNHIASSLESINEQLGV